MTRAISSLTEKLAEDRTLPDGRQDDDAQLMDALETYMDEIQRGERSDLAGVADARQELSDTLDEYVAILDLLNHLAADTEDSKGDDDQDTTPTRDVGDYRIIREIGRGGMGIVYEAEQLSLGRRVALKVLPFAAILDQKQVARFRTEAQAAAHLHHEHIVPVYAVGCERGIHHFAMQIVDGQPLDRAIRELRGLNQTEHTDRSAKVREHTGHKAPCSTPASTIADHDNTKLQTFSTPDSQRSSRYLRTIATLGIQVAKALQHAHDHGVIHRDIKPSNLILDHDGKLWVTDFGLARICADPSISKTGHVPGTPLYMSPEQAAGRSALVDERSDVYSLGVTLYELLTLCRPVDGDDEEDIRRRIQCDDPLAPRRANPSIPLDLETIVLKSLAKSREDRYNSAGELADDLQKFLDGRSPAARRPTLWDRFNKWTVRHKKAVAATVAVIMVATMGLAVATIMIARQKQQKLAAVKSHLNEERKMIDLFGAQMEQRLRRIPGAEPLRQQLLVDLLPYYQRLVKHAEHDPELEADQARNYFKLGSITEEIDDKKEAKAAYLEACRLFESLAGRYPNERQHQADLAFCYNNIGLLSAEMGETKEALAAYRSAIELQRGLVSAHSEDVEYSSSLAVALSNLAQLHGGLGEWDKAIHILEEAQQIRQELVKRLPENVELSSKLAITLQHLSFFCKESSIVAAEQHGRQAITVFEQLLERLSDQVPKNLPLQLTLQSDLALSYNNLGALMRRQEELGQAVAAHQRAVAVDAELHKARPQVTRYTNALAVSRNNLGRTLLELGNASEALAEFQQAKQLVRDLVGERSDEPSYHGTLGGILHNVGMTLEDLDQFDEALTAYREALGQQRRAFELAPQLNRQRDFLSKQLLNYARVLRLAGETDEAIKIAAECRDLRPDDPKYLVEVARQLVLMLTPISADGELGDLNESDLAEEVVAILRRASELGHSFASNLPTTAPYDRLQAHPEFAEWHKSTRRTP